MVSLAVIIASVAATIALISILCIILFYKPVQKSIRRRKHRRRSYLETLQMLCRGQPRRSLDPSRGYHPSLESISETFDIGDIEKAHCAFGPGQDIDLEEAWPSHPQAASLLSDIPLPPRPAHIPRRPTFHAQSATVPPSPKAPLPHHCKKSRKSSQKLFGTKKEYRFQRKKLALTGIKAPEPMSRISEESSRPSSVASFRKSLRKSNRLSGSRLSYALIGEASAVRLTPGSGQVNMVQVGYPESDLWLGVIESSNSGSDIWIDEGNLEYSEEEEEEEEMEEVDLT